MRKKQKTKQTNRNWRDFLVEIFRKVGLTFYNKGEVDLGIMGQLPASGFAEVTVTRL